MRTRSSMLRHALVLLPLMGAVLAVVLTAQSAPTNGAGKRLHALFDREWEWELSESPLLASSLGDKRWNDRWDDVSLAALERRQKHREDVLAKIDAFPRAELSVADQTHYDVFHYQYGMTVEGFKYRYHLIRTDSYGGVQNSEQIVDQLTFESVKDYDDWLGRLARFPEYIDQNIALMREGLRTNVLLPKVIVSRVRDQLDAQAKGEPAKSGFYRPFTHFSEHVPEADRTRLSAAGLERVRTAVLPAFAKLRDFIDREYLPASYDEVGWWQTSSGLEGYAYFARLHTTTELTPQQIHEIGLKQVASIRAEMERIKDQTHFTGTLAEFFTFLRTDPRFFYNTGPELLEGYRALAKRIDPELVKVIGTPPRMPYGVRPIPEAVAPNVTTAYANPGSPEAERPSYFMVNLYKPETRPKWEMLALTLHEAEPGHCLQGALAQEMESMPAFRRNAGFTAYVEGWALYSESLGEDMGLYDDDPYSRFGRLTYAMWRAVRLVVDTGMHTMRWDRARAIKYFMDNAAKTELDVTNEIDRYIGWPGQALAYKIGELKIQELRHRAEQKLGDRFKLTGFNDVVLSTGAVPLSLLETRVDEWIAEQQAGSR
jgi:uncharacterized protein (DUF885 family)